MAKTDCQSLQEPEIQPFSPPKCFHMTWDTSECMSALDNLIYVGPWNLGDDSVRWSWILFQFHNETEVPNFLLGISWELLGTQWLVGGLGWWFRLALGTFPKSLIFIGNSSRQKQPPTDHALTNLQNYIAAAKNPISGFQSAMISGSPKNQPGFQRTQLVFLVQNDAVKKKHQVFGKAIYPVRASLQLTCNGKGWILEEWTV